MARAWATASLEDDNGKEHELTVEFTVHRFREGGIRKYETEDFSYQLEGEDVLCEELRDRFGREQVDRAIDNATERGVNDAQD